MSAAGGAGAIRAVTTRPKGYVHRWSPQTKTLVTLENVRAVLIEFADYLPLTLRQVFYRMVGVYGYPKTENAYENLGNCLNLARRAGMIPWDAIRDDSIQQERASCWSGPDAYWTAIRQVAKRYRRDILESQPFFLQVWCEAAGMVPQLARVTGPYTVPVVSTSGFDSTTAKHDLAEQICETGKPAVILHMGDHDPSGKAIFEVIAEDVKAFVAEDAPGLEVEFRRVALTAEQVVFYGLPTSPPKASDSRSARWIGETCQLEALAPDQLARLLDGNLQEYFDPYQLAADRAAETAEREAILAELGNRGDGGAA